MPRFILLILTVVPLISLGGAPAHAQTRPAPLVGYTLPKGSREWPIDRRLMQFTPAADSAWRRTPAEGNAFADSLLGIARRSGDRTLKAAVHVWRGRKYANAYELPKGEADLDTAWALSLALRDSAGLCRVLTARGHGADVIARFEDARRHFTRLLPLAEAAGLPGLVGFAHRGLGGIAKDNGRYLEARRHLQKAIRLIPPERFENRHSRFLLAEVDNRAGHPDEARDSFLVVLEEARRRKDRWLEAAVFNDLGNLEYLAGDMAMADRYWEFAAGVFDSMGHIASAVNSRINRATALRELGRTEQALALLERQRGEAVRANHSLTELAVLGAMADVHRQMGRRAEAERLYRAVRAAAVEDALGRESASIELAGLLRETGRPHEAEALLDSLLQPGRGPGLLREHQFIARIERSVLRRSQGRAREALADMRGVESASRGSRDVSTLSLDAAIELARCQRALGRPDSAAVVLRRAAGRWERWRASISDLEWRERHGSGLSSLFAEYGLALLDARRGGSESRRAREAFDALQAFQARTLEERLHGRGLAGKGMRARITADSLRRGVLREGDLLVDAVATADTTFIFLVSRGGVSVRLLPPAARLERLHADWRAATLAGSGEAVVAAGLRRLSEELLAPIAAAFAGSRRVILSGGGPLALWPLGALTLPGESAPLGETREVSTVPSATLLAALRGAASPAAPRGLLAVGRTTDTRGRTLPGVERELRSLGSAFDAEVRAHPGERSVWELVSDLPRWNVLHFAAHAEAVPGSPWRSGFLLGRGSGDDAYLRASRVAGMQLRARLAVLSGCQSAGATTLAGEGALGLASAFLCSGTSSVVATLWPVEDRVAREFMGEFYAALSHGRTVAGAVGEAQRSLRSRAETSQVRDWAAFVASGEGGTRVRLGPRLTSGAQDRPTR